MTGAWRELPTSTLTSHRVRPEAVAALERIGLTTLNHVASWARRFTLIRGVTPRDEPEIERALWVLKGELSPADAAAIRGERSEA